MTPRTPCIDDDGCDHTGDDSVRGWLHRKWRAASLCFVLRREALLRRKLRVAVLGGGVGGTALCNWLRDLYANDLELSLVSHGPIGGRCQSVFVSAASRMRAARRSFPSSIGSCVA